MGFNRYDEKYTQYARQLVEQLAGNRLTIEESLFVISVAEREIKTLSNAQSLPAHPFPSE